MAFDLGDTVTFNIEVRDSAGALTNASTNTLSVILPDGTTATPATTNPSTGIYNVVYVPVQSGRHSWRWPTTAVATSEADVWNVLDAFPPRIVSLTEAKEYLNIPASETGNDVELKGFTEAVTRVIEHHVGAVVRRTVTPVIYPYCETVAVPYLPVLSLTSGVIVRDNSAVTITNLVVENGVLRDKTYAPLPFEPWILTYVVGRAIVPANIRMATLAAVKDMWSSQRGVSRPGQEARLPFMLSYAVLEALEPDMMLAGFA